MNRVFSLLRPLIRSVVRFPIVYLLAGLGLAALSLFYAAKLRVDSDFSKLIPEDYASVQALEKLRATVGGESEAAIAIESPSFEANKRFAEALIPRVLALKSPKRAEPYFRRVDYRKDVTFLQDNALYFATGEELDSLESFLNAKIEEARLEANPFFFDLEDEEDDAAPAADSAAIQLQEVYGRLVGKEYPVSDDSTTLVLRFYPSGAQTDVDFIADAYADLERLVAQMQPQTYQPQMEVTLAGRLLRQMIEVRAITDDVQSSFGAGVAAVLLMVVVYFTYKSYHARAGSRFDGRILLSKVVRAPILTLVIALPLLSALSWTFGLAYLNYETLNLMTSTLGLVLFGMGIDYGIHFYGRYTEERRDGAAPAQAAETTFMTTGQAITATAFTTSSAFFLLMIADFRGFSEFGFIAGTGILFSLVAMVVLMPALLVLFEKLGLLNLTAERPDGAGHVAVAPRRAGRGNAPRTIVGICAALTVAALFSVRFVQFEYDFGKLDPVYKHYNDLQEKVRRVYNDRGFRNPAYVVVDDPADVPEVAAAVRRIQAADTLTPTIRTVEYLQNRFPTTPDQAEAKLARLEVIRTLLADPFLAGAESQDLDRLRRAAGTTAPIQLDDVPAPLKQPYTSKDGTIGQLVIIYPSVGLSNGRYSIQFSEDVGTITTASGKVFHAGSTPLVAADMLRLMRDEAPVMVALTMLLILIFKLAILRSFKWAMLSLVPLIAGFVWLFGLMALFGLKLNFYNLVVLPAILGIGDDSGIHIVHRYIEEGRGTVWRILRSTGEQVSMSALTTMTGFGGQILSFYPGLRSIGILAVMGIGLTLLTAIVFLPALLLMLEARGKGPVGTHAHAAPEDAAA